MKGFVLLAAVLLAAGGSGVVTANHLASKNDPVVVVSGPAFTNRAFSCSGLPPKGTRPGDIVQLEARLGAYKAVLSGTVKTVGLPYDVTLSKPTVSVTDDGFTSSYDVLGPEPTTLFGLTFAPTAWNPNVSNTGKYRPSALCLAWLGSKYEPTVIVPVFTGGAHCCTVLNLFGSSGGIIIGAVNLGNPSAVLSAVGKDSLLVTADNAFAYAFTDYAGSAMPIQVLQVSPSEESVITVTRSWPSLIALDAEFWLSLFQRSIKRAPPHDERGLLAAWAADECELGKCASTFAFLHHVDPSYLAFSDNQTPPSAYILQLRTFLASHGYLRS